MPWAHVRQKWDSKLSQTIFLMRDPLAIYSLALQVLLLQIAVVALLLVTDLGMCVHTSNCICTKRKLPVRYLSLSVVESLLMVVSRQSGILGGASVTLLNMGKK